MSGNLYRNRDHLIQIIMKNKIVTHFYVREEKKDKKGEVPIYLRITINGERAGISTDQRVNPELWDKASQRVAGRTEPARLINTYLDTLLGKVGKYYSNLDVKDEMISVYQIISELKGKSQNQMALIKAYDFHITRIEELIGVDYAANTVKRYRSSLNGLKEFIFYKYDKTDLRLCLICGKSFGGHL